MWSLDERNKTKVKSEFFSYKEYEMTSYQLMDYIEEFYGPERITEMREERDSRGHLLGYHVTLTD